MPSAALSLNTGAVWERVVPTSHFDTTTRGCSYLQCSRSNKDLVVALVFEKANNCSYYLYLLYLCSTWHCPPPGFPDSWAFKQSVRTTSGCGPGPTAASQHSPRCPGCVPHTRCTRCSLTGRSCSSYSLEMWLIHWFIWYYFLLLIFFFFQAFIRFKCFYVYFDRCKLPQGMSRLLLVWY